MIDSVWLLFVIGLLVGGLGTLIGAGGGFILVPVLLFLYPSLAPDAITAISMAIVACNAVSGTVAYARAQRIDYKAGIQFAIFTIPGSILGVMVTRLISRSLFAMVFGGLLILLAFYLLFKKEGHQKIPLNKGYGKSTQVRILTDRKGETYRYSFNRVIGWSISLVVGFISPILGIGGGIIHVPALINWLQFPVHIATATSHFILAIMSVVSVVVHIVQGSYQDPWIQRMVLSLGVGAIIGAQVGAYFSHRIRGRAIERALAVSLGLVGIRILLGHL
ncbi:MAG: sulfite exporter TauE/SafE family protein [Chitinophagaceae bacterium]|nr:sulfite exporter TauE/SafE family protein [Chitinophagaceae bacterium]